MTLERQKKFLFISSKFQTPADKVIKVSRGETEGVQYLGERGSVWVESYLLFTKFLSPANLACLSITELGGFMRVITKLFQQFLSGSDSSCVVFLK